MLRIDMYEQVEKNINRYWGTVQEGIDEIRSSFDGLSSYDISTLEHVSDLIKIAHAVALGDLELEIAQLKGE